MEPKVKLPPAAHAGLFTVVLTGVLLAAYQQVVAHIGDNPVAVDLSTVQYRIPTTVDGDGFTAIYCGFSPLSTVTFLAAFCRINAGKDADTGTVTTGTDTDTHATATAAVPARCFLCVLQRHSTEHHSRHPGLCYHRP